MRLFGDPYPDELGGVATCSMEDSHRHRPVRARYRVYFKNGNNRDVCGHCVRKFQPGGEYSRIVKYIKQTRK